MSSLFEPVLADLSERHRDEILAAFAAVENSPEPVPEAVATALRDATMRRSVEEMLNLIGRTLVRAGPGRWTSGYRDDIAGRLTAGQPATSHALPVTDRAVLTLVLIHSVAIPRTEGTLTGDTWVEGTPTPVEELILAAGPDTPLAAAIRRRRSQEHSTPEKEHS